MLVIVDTSCTPVEATATSAGKDEVDADAARENPAARTCEAEGMGSGHGGMGTPLGTMP